jgi:hypothetical protein
MDRDTKDPKAFCADLKTLFFGDFYPETLFPDGYKLVFARS